MGNLEVVKIFLEFFSKTLVSNQWQNFGTGPGTATESQVNGHPTTQCFPRSFSLASAGGGSCHSVKTQHFPSVAVHCDVLLSGSGAQCY